ncbi:MAG: hydrogenase expression/formation protein HypE [Arcobacteraceae bacterium]|nr:hydrogenase expression/formation protein HypE [Arcobacteraceae bacterium]
MLNDKQIKLAHGNGGSENNELITKIFYEAFQNEILEKSEDAAIIENGKLAFCTDSFTISPIFFNGGDIGKISVCGTCNDLAMMGAKPKYLSLAVIIEEGFSVEMLQQIVNSIKKELAVNETIIVTGDTKVVPKGSVDKIFINTTGIGEVIKSDISANNIKEDDVIIVSRDIGTHGATIFAQREGIELESNLKSDCASLYPIIKKLLDENVAIHALRDATRGGVAAVLNEWARASNICIEVDEESLPVCDEVKGLCEILGFEATALANEGTFLIATTKAEAPKILSLLKQFNENASIIGKVTMEQTKKVILNSSWGTKRYLDTPTGELLPRIC